MVPLLIMVYRKLKANSAKFHRLGRGSRKNYFFFFATAFLYFMSDWYRSLASKGFFIILLFLFFFCAHFCELFVWHYSADEVDESRS